MPYGRDIFANACKFMAAEARDIRRKKQYMLSDDINYLVPHQANSRIMDHVAKDPWCGQSRVISNIEDTGNTGCASTLDMPFAKLAEIYKRGPDPCHRIRRRLFQRRDAAQEIGD